jgi:hypothetical protein
MDWSIPVHVLLIETHPFSEDLNEKCRVLLREKGFTFDCTCAHNELWLGPDVIFTKTIG